MKFAKNDITWGLKCIVDVFKVNLDFILYCYAAFLWHKDIIVSKHLYGANKVLDMSDRGIF